MNDKNFVMRCPHCGKEVRTKVVTEREELRVKGVDITVDANVRRCEECGEDLFDRDLDDATLKTAYAVYRNLFGLLQPEEIRAIRERYGLNQVSFARILGLGDKTIARYENGSLQDEAQNNLILLASFCENFAKLFEKNQDRLTAEERIKVEKLIPQYA